ncbi:MAG: universal stress protein [Dethiobacter sp.]|jgi:nucleotide-binding universal stress UspA family protein|nr:universal stress protein [Dethiobacter sp.]
MKILVCTDGSEQSQKAIEETIKIASGCSVDEVAMIHVYESRPVSLSWGEESYVSQKDIERLREWEEKQKEESKQKLSDAARIFEKNNLKVNTIFKEGHPADTIVKVATEEGFDMVVLGSRGLGGLKKLFLGSVSNAVILELKSNVLIVK